MFDFDKKIDRTNTRAIKWERPKLLVPDKNVVPMWVADMDLSCNPLIQEAIINRAKHPIYGYTDYDEEMLDNLCNWFSKRHNYHFNKSDIVLTTGVIPSLSLALRLFTNVHDEVIIMTPSYKPFYERAKANERVPLFTPLKWDNGNYVVDYDDLRSKMNKNVKAIILCNPHNPTGKVFHYDELVALAKFCEEYKLKIIADEIHCDFDLNYPFTSIMDINEYTRNNTISLISIGKTFNAAGIKISAAIIKNEALRKEFKRQVSIIGIDDINLFAYDVMKVAYSEESSQWFDELRAYLLANQAYALAYIDKYLPMIKTYKPEGTYFLWLDFRGCGIEKNKIHEKLLKDGKVMFNRGNFFLEEYDGYERMNLACSKAQLKECLDNLKDMFDNIK